jgi:hypothetical protein
MWESFRVNPQIFSEIFVIRALNEVCAASGEFFFACTQPHLRVLIEGGGKCDGTL